MIFKERIGKDIYLFSKYLDNVGITMNSFLILDEEPTIIETGNDSAMKEILPEITEIIDPEKISYIFITHEHLDHLGGLPELISNAYNAKIIAHEVVNVHIAFLGIYGKTHTVNGGEEIPIGSRYIRVHYAPVETKGYVYFELIPDGVFFTGDVFGQLTPGKYDVFAKDDEKALVNKITEFHNGLRYNSDEIKRYFGGIVKRKITLIAPSHGSMIKNNAADIAWKAINAKIGEKKESIWKRIFKI